MFIRNSPAKLRRGYLCVLAASLLAAPCLGEEEKKRAEEPIESVKIERIIVVAEKPTTETAEISQEQLKDGRHANLGELLCEVPGIAGVRRSQSAVEPVIRGLGWERVQTKVNGIPLYGACPGRMDPPASSIGGLVIQSAKVLKGLPSLSQGPPGTGGSVEISTDYDRGLHPGEEMHPWVEAGYDGARSGWNANAGVEGGNDRFDYRVGIEKRELDDYSSAEGIEVPAISEETAGFVSFGYRPDEQSRLSLSLIGRDGGRIDYPSLPMNADETTDVTGSLSYKRERLGKVLNRIELRAGFASVDHLMSNLHKPNRMMMEAETPSEAKSTFFGAGFCVSPRENLSIDFGLDYSDLARDATRSRNMLMGPLAGRTFYDHLWPDVQQDDLGVYAELHTMVGTNTQLRVGVRADFISSDALAADDPGLGGKTIREQWVSFYGDQAANPARDETLVSANLQLDWQISRKLALIMGLGQTHRAASMTERFYAFAPAPGGFQIGDPSLDAESKREVTLGIEWHSESTAATVSVFYNGFDDYIYQTTLDIRDINGDGIPDRIRGFENISATLYGAEFGAKLTISPRWSVPLSLAWVRGENDDTGTPLPEIPSLEGTLALRRNMGGREGGWLELGSRIADRQDRIDTSFGEDQTPGFAVFHLRGRFPLTDALVVQASMENLFDKEYHEHLTREAMLPVGDLGMGAEIPQPGRALHVSVRYAF